MIKAFLSQVRRIKASDNIIKNTKDFSHKIIKLSHQLEKGLVIRKNGPKAMWGWKKFYELINLLKKEKESFAYQLGKNAALCFLKIKEEENEFEEIKKAKDYIERFRIINLNENSNKDIFGCFSIDGTTLHSKKFEDVVLTRHSIRNFSSKEVSLNDIMKAIKLANHCPSACNRQPYKVYILNSCDKEKLGLENQINANKYLIITGIIDAFGIDEFNDWLVNASIFSGYLSLTLHYFGIGNCLTRIDLNRKTTYNIKIRRFLRIPDNEQICLEIAIGYYSKISYVTKSFKKPINEIIGGNYE